MHSHYVAATAIGYYGYAADIFALIPALFFLKEKLTGWPERRRQLVTMQRIGRLRRARDESFETSATPTSLGLLR